MGQLFQCPYCGARNQVGSQYCGGCGQRFYYTCTHCNNFVDVSFKFCPKCGTYLSWSAKPRANPTFPQALTPPPTPKHRRIDLVATAIVLLLLITTFLGYLTYRSSLATTLVPVGYESHEQVETTTGEPYVTAQPDSQYSGSPPYVKSPGEYIRLINNPAAINVDFKTLKDFLLSDETDSGWYIPGIQMCGYFAETLHNNAEQAGIRSAVVIVQFEDGSAPHALNAFETTDWGLVYIDCTGTRSSPATFEEWFCKLVYPRGQDRVAYVVKGKQYGTVPLLDAESTDYSFYLGYSKSSIKTKIFFGRLGVVKSSVIYW